MKSLPCVLCGKPATCFGHFIPTGINQILYGAPEGKVRHIFYGLCDECFSKGPEKIIPAIEQAALAECAGHTWN